MNADDIQQSDDNWQPSRAEELASQLLDEGVSEVSVANLSAADRRRIADCQWLDAMLEQAHGRNAESVARAVSATLTRLRADDGVTLAASESRGTRTRSRRWMLSVVAASIAVAIGLLSWPTAPASAAAIIEKAYQAARQATDREYRVTLDSDRSERGGAARIPREATLHVRGGDRFLLTFMGPLGRENRIGRDGDEFWFAPPIGPVFVADSETVVGQWLERSSLDMPYLQLTTLLERMRDRYELIRQPDERIGETEAPSHHIIAHLRNDAESDHRPDLPATIELWTDCDTDVVRRLIVTRAAPASRLPVQRITFDLVNERDLPETHYRLETHAPRRPIAPRR